jgi:hypothetical protein
VEKHVTPKLKVDAIHKMSSDKILKIDVDRTSRHLETQCSGHFERISTKDSTSV